jgi:hypothetical protein
MSWTQCIYCGRNGPSEEMVYIGINDIDGQAVDEYICLDCADLADDAEDPTRTVNDGTQCERRTGGGDGSA